MTSVGGRRTEELQAELHQELMKDREGRHRRRKGGRERERPHQIRAHLLCFWRPTSSALPSRSRKAKTDRNLAPQIARFRDDRRTKSGDLPASLARRASLTESLQIVPQSPPARLSRHHARLVLPPTALPAGHTHARGCTHSTPPTPRRTPSVDMATACLDSANDLDASVWGNPFRPHHHDVSSSRPRGYSTSPADGQHFVSSQLPLGVHPRRPQHLPREIIYQLWPQMEAPYLHVAR